MSRIFNFSARRVGGITFVRCGYLVFSFCISRRAFRPI